MEINISNIFKLFWVTRSDLDMFYTILQDSFMLFLHTGSGTSADLANSITRGASYKR